jgi:hypothetical protein
MSIKNLTPQEHAAVIADFAGNNFLEAARHFREVQDEAPELFGFVAQLSGISLRRAYALAAIHRTFYSLGIDHDYLRGLGWSKLQVIGPYITKANADHLLDLAEHHTVYELTRLMRSEKLHPGSRCVQLYFNPKQYDIFKKAILAHGGKASGRALINQEEALIRALSGSTKAGKS